MLKKSLITKIRHAVIEMKACLILDNHTSVRFAFLTKYAIYCIYNFSNIIL